MGAAFLAGLDEAAEGSLAGLAGLDEVGEGSALVGLAEERLFFFFSGLDDLLPASPFFGLAPPVSPSSLAFFLSFAVFLLFFSLGTSPDLFLLSLLRASGSEPAPSFLSSTTTLWTPPGTGGGAAAAAGGAATAPFSPSCFLVFFLAVPLCTGAGSSSPFNSLSLSLAGAFFLSFLLFFSSSDGA